MNRRIKTIISLLLLISVLFACVNTYAGEDDEEKNVSIFDTVLLKALDYNAKEWMSTESNRALFSACAILDFGLQEDNSFDIASFFSNAGPIYVGRAGFIVSAFYCDTEKNLTLAVIIDTRNNTQGGYCVLSYGKVFMEMAVEKACTDGYNKVDIVDFKEAIDGIMDVISN